MKKTVFCLFLLSFSYIFPIAYKINFHGIPEEEILNKVKEYSSIKEKVKNINFFKSKNRQPHSKDAFRFKILWIF